MFHITPQLSIPEAELQWSAVRASGAGGQHVNKVSTAVHLRFDIRASSLPQELKQELLNMRDHRISKQGIIVIKAQSHRSQERNREEALLRLQEMLQQASQRKKLRKPTRPSRAVKQRRLGEKSHHGRLKALRGRVRPDTE